LHSLIKENAIKNEEYEKAAELRDKLKGLTK
jgi:protein-arginine kinase activator protein McsA